MVINRLSVSVSGFGVGCGLVHTALAVVSGCFRTFRGRRFTTMAPLTVLRLGASLLCCLAQKAGALFGVPLEDAATAPGSGVKGVAGGRAQVRGLSRGRGASRARGQA